MQKFLGYKCISFEELKALVCDVILISHFNYLFFLDILDEQMLINFKSANIAIRPLIKLEFKDFVYIADKNYYQIAKIFFTVFINVRKW